ncbi:MAG TPA: hypothetical protein VFM71_12985 [Gemmatimonadaceae bacterium]|nr:hypothetical protein [Gemmatimonadaceae bacterium]
MRDLALVIARWRADEDALRRCGNVVGADLLKRCADEATEAAEEWLTWLSEADAALRSGRSIPWLRARFEGWKREGHARQTGRTTRVYRAAIVPRRANLVQAAEAGRKAARELRGAAA